MKILLRLLPCSLFLAAAFPAPDAAANLLTNGDFTGVTYSGTLPVTTLFGQFGTRTGVTLTVANWATTGFNFVYAPNTADTGTESGGANAGQPHEAPGQFNNADGYGHNYLWGSNNGGTVKLPATSPGGGNFLAADGDSTLRGAITQSVSGLTVGKVYAVSFYWAAGQQQAYTGNTTEQWQVSLGTVSASNPAQTTTLFNLTSQGFSGWMLTSLNFTANATTETLSFLALGTPNGQPPFLLLGNVSLDVVPEFSNWMVFAGFGALCTVVEVNRRRRQQRPTLASVPVS